MKKLSVLVASILLLVSLVGCANTEKKLLNPNYSSSSFFDIEEGDPHPNDRNVSSVISTIPSDQYAAYPVLQNVPVSATLYKDGEAVSIDVRDPRLIRLVNFFNNTLCYDKCSYLLSYLSDTDLGEDVVNEVFRLEIKYKPCGEKLPGPYENEPTKFDTIIVTNSNGSFVLINHDYPNYMGDEQICSVWAARYFPIHWSYPWLDLFGF